MEQKQLSSHTKIKKKCASILHPVFFSFCILKIRATRKTDGELGFIVQHKLNQIKCLNNQTTTTRILNRFRPTSHIAGEGGGGVIPPSMGSKNALLSA